MVLKILEILSKHNFIIKIFNLFFILSFYAVETKLNFRAETVLFLLYLT